MNRKIQQVIRAQPSMDGAGVAIQRVAGFEQTGMDPILMIDELRSEHREDFAAGFPSHPHRGMQTLTYMKHGGIIHEDSQGNRGEIRSGGAQYMSAGRGIIHSEMPTQDSMGLHGFQLWFNLPAAQKMQAPRYRDLPLAELAQVGGTGLKVTAISGEWIIAGTSAMDGPLHELAPQAAMADVSLEAGVDITLDTEPGESVMAYVYDGSVNTGGANYVQRQLLLFGDGERLMLQGGPTGAGFLLLRGRPIGEKVVHYGPFVMNTEAEIEQAIVDYQSGRFAA
ncbi:pirin family protein [Congregibacter sp.]|jgi:redox-sensitive bicupin YhaK (pirin superfamily)|uniref:pirin family protein n=1 Tax=Congregibacter sp. TaxID=2744308 RepID=UPI0039E39390